METYYPRIVEVFKLLPLSWIDRMLSRTLKNYRSKRALETAVVSNLGRFDPAVLSCPGFQPERAIVMPVFGSVFSTLICVGEEVEMANGRRSAKGKCPTCGTGMNRILGKKA